jgi:hypothetical protein
LALPRYALTTPLFQIFLPQFQQLVNIFVLCTQDIICLSRPDLAPRREIFSLFVPTQKQPGDERQEVSFLPS